MTQVTSTGAEVSTVSRSIVRTKALVKRVIKHPSWAVGNIQNFLNHRHNARIAAYPIDFEPTALTEALVAITGANRASIDALLADVPQPRLHRPTVLFGNPNGSAELVKTVYVTCRILQPNIVVETGVANGFTSAAILEALHENDKGILLSIDLPHLHPNAETSVGAAVPHHLADRWKLNFGPAAPMVRKLLPILPAIDVFVQDASHDFRGQLSEYRAAWSHIKAGGVLISDDVGSGFSTFAKEVGMDPVFIAQPKSAPIGVLQKRSSTDSRV